MDMRRHLANVAALGLASACGPLGCADAAGPMALGDSTDSGVTMDVPEDATGDVTGDLSTSSAGPESASEDDGPDPEPPPEPVAGLFAEYFTDYHDGFVARIEPTIDLNWEGNAPDPAVGADHFSLRYTGWLTAPTTATYTIVTEADDGVRVRLGDTTLIDDWIPHAVTRNEAAIDLVAGVPVALEVEYFEIDIAASLRLAWSSPTLAEQTIPTSALSTLATPSMTPGPKPPYTNPVVGFDCPDPGVVATDEDASPWAMVCTGGSFPIRGSRDLVRWADTAAAILPAGKPSWAANGFRNWAPELHRVGGDLVAYYTSVNANDSLCIGTATSATLAGPWLEGPAPLVEHFFGVIDATWVTDGGQGYLVFKIDGNAVGQPTPIFARALTADGLGFVPGSEAVELLVNDPASWEGGVVEAPWIVWRDGQWLLFYSGNVYDHRYRTGVARSASLLGPYEKHGAPILTNNERWVGPGHGSVVTVSGIDYFVYHAWTNAGDGTHNGAAGRHVLVDRIDYEGGWPRIHDGSPSRSLQPWPGTPPQG